MKKKSVLIRRAAILTAAVLLVTVVVVLAGSAFFGVRQARQAEQARLLAAARHMAAGDEAAREAAEAAYTAQYGAEDFAWALLDLSRNLRLLPGQLSQQAAEALLSEPYQGHENAATLRDGQGKSRAYAAVPVWSEGVLQGVLVTSARAPGVLSALRPSALAMALALAAAVLVAGLLVWKLISPVAERIRGLTDVAVRVADGDFEAHADEEAPGELGDLGQALNDLSSELSRNMYMLIVERNRLKHMLNGLNEGIVAVDAKGRITHRNPALERLFAPELMPVDEDARMRVIPDRAIWEDFDQVLASGESVTRNLEVRDMVVRLVITPILDEIGANVGAVGMFSDITQMERLERTRRDYVANVSHEMRTPLTAMRALIEPLKEGMVTKEEDRMRYYDIIMREILRLSRLINDLMELSRLQSGSLAIRTQKMWLEDLVLDVCERYRSIAEDHGLAFSVDSDFTLCPQVVTNPDRVEQLLVILLDNAIKYTPEGGKVSLAGTWNQDRVVLSVRDTGIGISAEDLPYIFDRFYKVDKAHSGMGSGLGLSIARELLKWMGEEIWVHSEKGKGSEFSFTVRRAKEGEA